MARVAAKKNGLSRPMKASKQPTKPTRVTRTSRGR